MTRRHIQAQNRKANKFGLQPFVPALTITAQEYVDGLAAHVRGTVAVMVDTIPADQIVDVDAIVEGTNHLIDDIKAQKPARWPHNKHLACCGQAEKNCECGSARRYI
jgi:hypothetical protein